MQLENLESNENNKIGYLFMSAFCLIYIALFCWLGFYAWPQADDWGILGNIYVDKIGLFQYASYCYKNVNGRFLSFVLYWLFFQIPFKNLYGLYPLITLAMYFTAAYFFIHTVYYSSSRKIKFLLALIITAVTLSIMEVMGETIYWLSAMHYVWSQVLLILSIALALRALNGSKVSFLFCIITLFLDSILLEQPVIFQGVAAFLAALYFLYFGERKKAAICGIFWLVSVTGFLIMYFAPGTAHRIAALKEITQKFASSQNNANLSLTSVILNFLYTNVLGVSSAAFKFFTKPIIYIFILFVPCIAEKINFADKRIADNLRAWHIILCVIITAVSMQLIIAAASGGVLGGRTESVALWIMNAVWFFMWGFLYRNQKILSRIKNLKIFKLRWPALVLCLLIAPNFTYLIRDLRIAPIYRAENIEQLETALEQDKNESENIIVPLIAHKPQLLFFSGSKMAANKSELLYWINKGFAHYLGLKKDVYAVPKSIYKNPDVVKNWRNGNINNINFDWETEADISLIYDIGNMYDAKSAKSVFKLEKDNKKAVELYQKVSSRGYNQANRSLARIYLTDKDLKDYSQGIYWLSRYLLGLIIPSAI